jgi:protein ImuB
VRDADHLARLFQGKLDRLDPGFGIETALLAARAVDPLAADQATLATAAAPAAQQGELDRLIDRLANRLGPGGVASLRPRASHLPERAQVLAPPQALVPLQAAPGRTGGGTPGGGIPGTGPKAPRPLYLLPQPEPVDVLAPLPDGPPAAFRWRRRQHCIVQAHGPERIAPEWWRDLAPDDPGNDTCARDYYRVADETGGRFWLYRAGGFSVGPAHPHQTLPGQPPRWFLHGLFA